MSEDKVLIIGSGGQARVNVSIIKQSYGFRVSGIIDLSFSGKEEEILGVPVVGGLDALDKLIENDDIKHISLAIGDNSIRREWYERLLEKEMEFPSFVSDEAFVDPSIENLGDGNLFSPFVHIGPHCDLGNNIIFNTRSTIEHESKIGSHSHIAPHSIVLGRNTLGEEIFLGANSTVLPSLSIVNKTIIGANSLVSKSIKEQGVYLGTPTKKLTKG